MRGRQKALLCDNCGQWRHRTCGTGMGRAEYRDLNRHVKADEQFCWICPKCAESVVDQPDVFEAASNSQPTVDQEVTFVSASNNQSLVGQFTMTPSEGSAVAQEVTFVPEFDVDATIDEVIDDPQEPLLGIQPIPVDIPEDCPVEYSIINTGTQRSKARLHDSEGYIYTVKKQNTSGTYW